MKKYALLFVCLLLACLYGYIYHKDQEEKREKARIAAEERAQFVRDSTRHEFYLDSILNAEGTSIIGNYYLGMPLKDYKKEFRKHKKFTLEGISFTIGNPTFDKDDKLIKLHLYSNYSCKLNRTDELTDSITRKYKPCKALPRYIQEYQTIEKYLERHYGEAKDKELKVTYTLRNRIWQFGEAYSNMNDDWINGVFSRNTRIFLSAQTARYKPLPEERLNMDIMDKMMPNGISKEIFTDSILTHYYGAHGENIRNTSVFNKAYQRKHPPVKYNGRDYEDTSGDELYIDLDGDGVRETPYIHGFDDDVNDEFDMKSFMEDYHD